MRDFVATLYKTQPAADIHASPQDNREVFGQALNNSTKLANTVLSYMVVCMYGGPKFLCKMLPVKELNADFLFKQTNILLENLKEAGAKVIAIVCDGNRLNQAFFKKFDTIFPWLTKDNLFFLFDYVHIFKNIFKIYCAKNT